MAATPINILIDGESLLKQFNQVSIKFSEGMFCNSIDLGIISDELWTKFDPIVNFGLLRLQVILGTTNYEFLIEERNTTVSVPGISFTSWGRSAQALLDKPYANPLLTDLEEKIHPWQNANVSATSIINYAINYCCSAYTRSKVVIHWNVEDFIVYKDTFSTSNSSPIEIISQLAGIIGAEFIANADGSLTVQEYSVGTLNLVTKLTEDISIQDYNDMDHIVSLNDDIVYPIGYNSVIVNGYGIGGSNDQNSAYLSAELQDDDLKGWEYGRARKVKVYNYHPKGLPIRTVHVGGSGSSSVAYNGTESRVENVLLTWGNGSTQYPNIQGISDVQGDKDVPLAFTKVYYTCHCALAHITSYIRKTDSIIEGIAAFYFSDKSSMSTIGFGYYDPDPETIPSDDPTPDTDPKSDPDLDPGIPIDPDPTTLIEPYDIQLELNETDEDVNQFYIKGIIYGYDTRKINRIYNTSLGSILVTGGDAAKYFIEDVVFTKGVGNLSHPYDSCLTFFFYNHEGHNLRFQRNRTEVIMSDYKTSYVSVETASVYYGSLFAEVRSNVPGSFTGKSFSIYLDTIDGDVLSISKTVTNEDIVEPPIELPDADTKDVSILVKDFATDVVIPNANVTIDGSSRGSTDSEGIINLIGIKVGDHTIRITASGYLDSDEDELANDTFTVS